MTFEAILYLIAGLMLAFALAIVAGMIRTIPIRAPGLRSPWFWWRC